MINFIIKDKKNKRIIYVDVNNNGEYHAFYYENRQLHVLSDISNYLSFLSLSVNNKLLTSNDDYIRYQDLDTGFIHYFKDNKEDYLQFLQNNGKNLTICLSTNMERRLYGHKKIMSDTLEIIFDTCYSLVISSFLTILLAKGINKSLDENLPGYILKDFYSDITVSRVETLINDSDNITLNEKSFLCNENFLNDIINYVKGTHMDFTLLYRLKDLEIVSFNDLSHLKEGILGYYTLRDKIYAYAYDSSKLDKNALDIIPYNNIIGHEFIHMFMANYDYAFLSESVAAIMADEYFTPTWFSNNKIYYNIKTRTKILMEIIGAEPIKRCIFSDDDSLLISSINTYLKDERALNRFIAFLKTEPDNMEYLYPEMDYYLDIMYQNKYGISLKDSKLITCIEYNFCYHHAYFNNRLNENNSYYLYTNYDDIDIYYNEIEVNKVYSSTFLLKVSAKIGTFLEPNYDFHNSNYILIVNYSINPDYQDVSIDYLTNLITFKKDNRKYIVSPEIAKNLGVITYKYTYYKKYDKSSKLSNYINLDISNSSIYSFTEGITFNINNNLLECAKNSLLDKTSYQEISETSSKNLTLTFNSSS